MNVLRCLTWVTVLAAGPAWADDSPLSRCRTLSDDRARLACYDAIQPLVAPVATEASAKPGFGLPAPQRSDDDDALHSRISGSFEGWDPKTVLKLDNGQAWQIVDGSSAFYVLQDPRVRIVRGSISGYLLEVEGVAQRPRVRRIK